MATEIAMEDGSMTDLDMARLLAEKIMGWELDYEHRPHPEGPPTMLYMKAWDTDHTYRTVMIGPGDWWPLKSIGHAWEVLERIALCAEVIVTHRINSPRLYTSGQVPITVQISAVCASGRRPCTDEHPFPAGLLRESEAVDSSATRAICVAALRAVGVEV